MLKTLLHCKGSQILYSAITHVYDDADANVDVDVDDDFEVDDDDQDNHHHSHFICPAV